MITMKRILALPILLTCFWLGWVIFNQFRPGDADVPPAADTISATDTISADGTSSPGISPSADAAAEAVWEPYTPAKVADALAARRPVFINFTAKWCLVCLLNDKTSLSTETFRRLVTEKISRFSKPTGLTATKPSATRLKPTGATAYRSMSGIPPENKPPSCCRRY